MKTEDSNQIKTHFFHITYCDIIYYLNVLMREGITFAIKNLRIMYNIQKMVM